MWLCRTSVPMLSIHLVEQVSTHTHTQRETNKDTEPVSVQLTLTNFKFDSMFFLALLKFRSVCLEQKNVPIMLCGRESSSSVTMVVDLLGLGLLIMLLVVNFLFTFPVHTCLKVWGEKEINTLIQQK